MGRIPCVLVGCVFNDLTDANQCVVDRTSLEQPITSIELFKVSWNKMTCCWLTPFMAHFWATTTNEPIIVLISVFVFSLGLCLFLGLCLDHGLCLCLVLGSLSLPILPSWHTSGQPLQSIPPGWSQAGEFQLKNYSHFRIIIILDFQNTFHVKTQVSPM